MSSELSSNSQIKIVPTVSDLVTIIQEKRSRSAAVGYSQVKFIKSLLVAISGSDVLSTFRLNESHATIIFIGLEREGS